MVKATVKWGKETFEIDIDAAGTGLTLKAQLLSLTSVPVDRQKLMSKAWAGILKDETALASCKLADGMVVQLMGSAEGVAKPVTVAKFVEDMPQSEVAKLGHVLPTGLVNEGNTCYANSTLEALRFVPELKDALVQFKRSRGGAAGGGAAGGAGAAAGGNLYAQLLAAMGADPAAAGAASFPPGFAGVDMALGDLFTRLDESPKAVFPAAFLNTLRATFPQFDERGPGGGHKQQDAEEFHGSLMTALAAELKSSTPAVPTLRPGARSGGGEANLVDTIFGIETEVELKCRESDVEPPVRQREFHRKLVCNIEGGAGRATQINHMAEGIMHGLTGEVEKRSELLGRNAVWSRVSRLTSLPKYLCVQFMRFYWKATPESRDHAGVKCKMLRPVSFPADGFDVYDMCASKLQAKLRALRGDKDAGKAPSPTAAAGGAGAAAAAAAPAAGMDEDDELAAALRMSMDGAAAGGAGAGASSSSSSSASATSGGSDDEPIGYGLPEGFTGLYELFAVVTHKGRSADSGHYIAFVRRNAAGADGKGDRNSWLVFDDDSVSEATTEWVIANLKGGGDEHMAHVNFYRAVSGGK